MQINLLDFLLNGRMNKLMISFTSSIPEIKVLELTHVGCALDFT